MFDENEQSSYESQICQYQSCASFETSVLKLQDVLYPSDLPLVGSAGGSSLSSLCFVWGVLPGPNGPGWLSNARQVSHTSCTKCEDLPGFMGFLTAVDLFLCTCLDVLVSWYIEGLKSPQILTRSGSALALGCLPRLMIHSKLKQVGFFKCAYS